MKRIVVTGPESTGKTELAKSLASRFSGDYIPEYSRKFVENLGRNYELEDVLLIADKQMSQMKNTTGKYLFFDTWLIITKIWLQQVYGERRDWIDDAIENQEIDIYLLCATDIPWVPDPVRENGGKMRELLFGMYRDILEQYNKPYAIITGKGPDRLNNAIFAIEQNNIF